jgi:hypothetical protein
VWLFINPARVSKTLLLGRLTGYLLRQPRVRDKQGVECLLDELLGAGFSIVGKDAAALTTSPDLDGLIQVLEIEKVDLSQLTLVQGRFDEAMDALEALIVRPDRVVYGHTEAGLSLNTLLRQLALQLGIQSAAATEP